MKNLITFTLLLTHLSTAQGNPLPSELMERVDQNQDLSTCLAQSLAQIKSKRRELYNKKSEIYYKYWNAKYFSLSDAENDLAALGEEILEFNSCQDNQIKNDPGLKSKLEKVDCLANTSIFARTYLPNTGKIFISEAKIKLNRECEVGKSNENIKVQVNDSSEKTLVSKFSNVWTLKNKIECQVQYQLSNSSIRTFSFKEGLSPSSFGINDNFPFGSTIKTKVHNTRSTSFNFHETQKIEITTDADSSSSSFFMTFLPSALYIELTIDEGRIVNSNFLNQNLYSDDLCITEVMDGSEIGRIPGEAYYRAYLGEGPLIYGSKREFEVRQY
ncbi:MAG: hypothetical protein HOE90_01455 [Bacteriovoracaceae bacterium]|nr:hypothetical protein [Bacteriovoracaceae bacterium]